MIDPPYEVSYLNLTDGRVFICRRCRSVVLPGENEIHDKWHEREAE